MQTGLLDGLVPIRGAGPRTGPQPMPASPLVYPEMLNGLNYGMDPGGAGCNAEAFIQAVQASLPPTGATGYPKLSGANSDYYLPGQGLYVPPGFYLFNRTANFQKLIVDSTLINNWQLVCDPGAIFLAGPGVGASPLIDMTPPAGAQFSAGCNVQFGQLIGSGVAGQTGLVARHFSNSTLRVYQIEGFSGSATTSIGMDVNQVGATFPMGNNYIFLPLLSSNGIGFRTNGSVGAFGFQGNTVYFGDVTFNTGDGVVIDSGGVGLSSTYNRYFVGAIEHNGGFGIRDNAGASQWHIGNSNSNTSGGITFAATLGAGRIPYVEGYLTDTTPLVGNSNKVDITNLAQDIGVSAPAPAIPLTGAAVANTFDTPVDVYIKGGTISIITVNSVTTGFVGSAAAVQSGPYRLLPGELIAMTYTVAPTWVWLRSR